MMSAISASQYSNSVYLLEKNESLGSKLLLTGKGRCNFTSAKSIPDIVESFGKKGRFLYSAFTRFSNQDLINFFAKNGVKSKTERGQRVFPVSDKAEDIVNCLQKQLHLNKVKFIISFPVKNIFLRKDYFLVKSTEGRSLQTKRVVIATGGLSYPATGSTGDGYTLAKKLGHQIILPMPALVALFSGNKDVRSLAGLSLKNVSLSFFRENILLTSEFGEMLFTHSGISGPIVLSQSKKIAQRLADKEIITAVIDFKPALSGKELQTRIYRDIHSMPKKEFQTLLSGLVPKSLMPVLLKNTGIDKHIQNSLLSKENIENIVRFLKSYSFFISATAPIETAIVTAGGIPINEIDQRTMESKIVPGLYFAGEIIAVDGPTGGYNLQKAFSTGWLAGKSAGQK